jgi:hypothetical protein
MMGPGILDRSLTHDALDAALRVARSGAGYETKLRMLEVALDGIVTRQEATNKTRKVLTRIWINPPEPAQQPISWVLEQPAAGTDSRLFHIGAMLATYPFFGLVCATVGRQLALNGVVDGGDVKQRVQAVWGDRAVVAQGTTKSIRTLRNLDMLGGSRGSRVSKPADRVSVPDTMTGWVVHALLLTRSTQRVGLHELNSAPELFMLDLSPNGDYGYPFVEPIREGVTTAKAFVKA